MKHKKSLYEILEVPTNASYPEIRIAHERLLKSLESQHSVLSREDYTIQVRLLKVAYSTLSTPMSRDAYDAQLSTRGERAKPDVTLPATISSAGDNAAIMRADALMMRADAMALRAEALGLKADIFNGGPVGHGDAKGGRVVSRLFSSFKTVLLTLGTLVAAGMIIKVIFLLTMTRQSDEAVDVRSAAGEKVFLQEYYQTHGVRPANRAEAVLMDAERRKSEDAARAQKMMELDQKNASQSERDFEMAARKRGEQVAIELQYAQERAQLAQLREDRQKEDEKRMAADAERRRIETEQAKWKNTLRSNSY
jgi:hypothetical protein